MQRREFLRSALGALAGLAIPPGLSIAEAKPGNSPDSTRRVLYVMAQLTQTNPSSLNSLADTLGGSGFNVLVLSFLQASVSNGKLTLLYNGNPLSLFVPSVPTVLARLRSGYGMRKRVLLSIGGWGTASTFEAMRSFGVSAFVRQLTNEVILPLGLDGIDLDLEPAKGGLDQWMGVHHEHGKTIVDLTNEYKRVHPTHVVTHAPISPVAAEIYVKNQPISGLQRSLLEGTRTNDGNNIDWLNVQFYEGGAVEGGDIAGYYRNSLAAPLMDLRRQTGITSPLHFLTPLFEPNAKQPLEFCQQTIAAINRRCADLHVGTVNGIALWDYRQVASSIDGWSQGLEKMLRG